MLGKPKLSGQAQKKKIRKNFWTWGMPIDGARQDTLEKHVFDPVWKKSGKNDLENFGQFLLGKKKLAPPKMNFGEFFFLGSLRRRPMQKFWTFSLP